MKQDLKLLEMTNYLHLTVIMFSRYHSIIKIIVMLVSLLPADFLEKSSILAKSRTQPCGGHKSTGAFSFFSDSATKVKSTLLRTIQSFKSCLTVITASHNRYYCGWPMRRWVITNSSRWVVWIDVLHGHFIGLYICPFFVPIQYEFNCW